MRKYLLLVVALLALAAFIGPVAQAATNSACGYAYTNDDNYTGVNSVTVFKCDTANTPPLTRVTTVNTGGNGQGGGYFGADRIKILASQNTLFASDSGTGTISIFDISNPASPVLKNTFPTGMGGDISLVSGGKCLLAGFANYGVINAYSVSGFNLTQVGPSLSAGTIDGMTAGKSGSAYYVAWGNLGGYGYATVDSGCNLGTANSVGGVGGEAGVELGNGMIYIGLANGGNATLEYGTFPGGALATVTYTNGGWNSNNVVVTSSCAYLSASWGAPITGVPLGIYAIPLTGGVPGTSATWAAGNASNYYAGPPALRKGNKGLIDLTTSGFNDLDQYQLGSSCSAITYKGTSDTTVVGPFSMSSTFNPQAGF